MPRGGFNAGREELAQPWGCRGAMNSGFEQSVCPKAACDWPKDE